jgi:excisionase family DNA binding protein
MKPFLSIKDVAKYLGVEYKTVYRLVRKGAIPATKVGGMYRIRREDVDTYLERQKVVASTEVRSAKKVDQALKCSVCLRLLGKGQVKEQCAQSDCDSPICPVCWEDGARYCLVHQPSRVVLLAEAQNRLASGEIAILVTALEAKQREISFVSRFDRKVQNITMLRHPLGGHVIRVAFSWSDVQTSGDESVRLMDLMKTGYLDRAVEQEVPLNAWSRYTVPTTGDIGLVLEARVLSHLPAQVRVGYDTKPASLADLLRVLEACIQMAESEETAYVIGVASTTGWHPDARTYIESSGAGRSFSHRLVVPCLVDLHEMTLTYDELDSRLAPLVSLFAPQLPEEEVERAMDHILRALLTSHGVTADEICEEAGVAEEYVRIAFRRLVEQGTHRLDKIPSVGQVLTQARP